MDLAMEATVTQQSLNLSRGSSVHTTIPTGELRIPLGSFNRKYPLTGASIYQEQRQEQTSKAQTSQTT